MNLTINDIQRLLRYYNEEHIEQNYGTFVSFLTKNNFEVPSVVAVIHGPNILLQLDLIRFRSLDPYHDSCDSHLLLRGYQNIINVDEIDRQLKLFIRWISSDKSTLMLTFYGEIKTIDVNTSNDSELAFEIIFRHYTPTLEYKDMSISEETSSPESSILSPVEKAGPSILATIGKVADAITELVKPTENVTPIQQTLLVKSAKYNHYKLTTNEMEVLLRSYNRDYRGGNSIEESRLEFLGYLELTDDSDVLILTPKAFDWINNFENMSSQDKILTWANITFKEEAVFDRQERGFRFCEEALELVQAVGIDKQDILKLIDYVYERPKGDKKQEIGGVLTTLSVLASVNDLDIDDCLQTELNRIWLRIDQIRKKQQTKPKASPLPGRLD